MAILTEVMCENCKGKTNLLTRTKFTDKKYVCSKCTKIVPSYMKEAMSKFWSYDDYKYFLEYNEYQKNELQNKFVETNSYGSVHLDSVNGLFYIDGGLFEDRFILQLEDIKVYDFFFIPTQYNDGLLGGKVIGDVTFALFMERPSFNYIKKVNYSVKARAKRAVFSDKVTYEHPDSLLNFEIEFYAALGNVCSKNANEIFKNRDGVNLE